MRRKGRCECGSYTCKARYECEGIEEMFGGIRRWGERRGRKGGVRRRAKRASSATLRRSLDRSTEREKVSLERLNEARKRRGRVKKTHLEVENSDPLIGKMRRVAARTHWEVNRVGTKLTLEEREGRDGAALADVEG